MRKITLILLLTILCGCQNNETRQITDATKNTSDTETNISTDIVEHYVPGDAEVLTEPEDNPDLTIYKKWMMDYTLGYDSFYDYARPDCIGMENGNSFNGDLLSSIIIDTSFRKRIDTQAYTPTYVAKLEKKIASKTRSEYGSDFYAYYVCHLDNNFDLAAGYLWLSGNKFSNAENSRPEEEYGLSAFAIVNKDNVKIHSNFRTLNRTATGAEVHPCQATRTTNGFTWDCFDGLDYTEEDTKNKISSKYIEWEFDEQGNILSQKAGNR